MGKSFGDCATWFSARRGKGIRNANGEVVVPLRGSAWYGTSIQTLSAGARGCLLELLMRLGNGVSICPLKDLMASLYLDEAELDQFLNELAHSQIVKVESGQVTLQPEITRLLLTGVSSESGTKR